MTTKKIPTTPRMPWHRPEDRFQVLLDSSFTPCRYVSYPTEPRWRERYNDWEYGVYDRENEDAGLSYTYNDGPLVGRDVGPEESRASLRRIVAPTKAALARYNREQAAAKRAADKAAKAEAAAKARAERDKARTLAALPARAQAVVKAFNADRSAFGCQRKAVIALVGAILGCDLGKVVEL